MEIVYQSKEKAFEQLIKEYKNGNWLFKKSQSGADFDDGLFMKLSMFKDSPRIEIKRSEDLSCYTFQTIELNYQNHIIREKILYYNDGKVLIQKNGKYRRMRKDIAKKKILDFITYFYDLAWFYDKTRPNGVISKEEIDNFTKFLKTLYPFYQELENLINMFNATKSQREKERYECTNTNQRYYDYDTLKVWKMAPKARTLVKAFEKAPKSIKKIMLMASSEGAFICSLTKFSLIRWCGFKDVNVIRVLMSKDHQVFSIFRSILSFKRAACKNTNSNPELVLCNQTKEFNCWDKRDAILMIDDIFGKENLKKFLSEREIEKIKKYIGSHNLSEIHDFIMPYARKCYALKAYKEYEYNENELKMEQIIDDISFKIPRNSIELAELGAVMHNCVAGYNNSIASKYSLIIYGVNKNDNSAKCCIELRPCKEDNAIHYHVAQCFAPYNKPVKDDVKDACTKLFISINNCVYKNVFEYDKENTDYFLPF